MQKIAIILGATGLTGGILLKQLLQDDSISTIKLFSRSSSGVKDPKVREYLIDMFQLERETERFTGDVVFCCIGTTKSKTPDKETYKKIDYGIPVTAAKLAKQNSIPKFIVISALGANPDSSVFYNKVKGEMERDVLQQNISETYILQPSLIGGNRSENRMGESIAKFFAKTFGFLIPKKYKMIEPETIAKAMQNLIYKPYSEKRIPSDKIKEIVESNPN
ncbi:NAD(P)H-binding protein [Marixanthomonas spongiae]|uniref:Nucleoside-diphosphate sugar epimerase n=1 Tax=Marixanthomonas spongiae TaxID=2174845 RepID=A0A2U0I2P7_9FLAO|nr:NAD(P)H-binding protein [Marixanthomonas spongiae]PVW15377.1 nucleoside-diphosphate sugar epimerase [Marixanthomonas spongiae]